MATIERKYIHKGRDGNPSFGYIGDITIEFPVAGWKLNGVEMPEKSVFHWVNHGAQSLQDAYAGAKSESDAIGRFEKKFDRITGGLIGVRTREVDPVAKLAIALAESVARGDTVKARHENAVAMVKSSPVWMRKAAEQIAELAESDAERDESDVELPDESGDAEETLDNSVTA